MKIKHSPLFFAILLFGLLYRALFLFEPIRDDEGYTILNLAPKSIQTIRSDYSTSGNHVLYSILTHYTFKIFGTSRMKMAVRLPALISGLLIIYLTYVLAVLWTEEYAVAYLSAFLVAASLYNVFYSVNGRGYTLQTVWVLVLTILCFSLPEAGPISPLQMALIAFLEPLIPYTIPSGIIFVIPFHIWLLFWWRRRAPATWARHFAYTSLGAFLVGLLLIAPLLHDVHVRGSSSPELSVFGELLHRVCEGLLPLPVFFTLLFVGLKRHPRASNFRFFVLMVLVPYSLMAALLNPIAPWIKFVTRCYLPLFPFAFIGVSCGIAYLFRWRPSARWAQRAICAGIILILLEWPASAAYTVSRNPALLYFPQRPILLRCEQLIPALSRTLKPGERVAGCSFYTDLGAAFYVTNTLGFHGFYSLYKLDQFRINRLFLIAETAQAAEETCKSLGTTAWSPPVLLIHDPPIDIYVTRRLRSREDNS